MIIFQFYPPNLLLMIIIFNNKICIKFPVKIRNFVGLNFYDETILFQLYFETVFFDKIVLQ